MPCYSVTTMQVELKVADISTLKNALSALGYSWIEYGDRIYLDKYATNEYYDIINGQIVCRNQLTADRIIREYSAEIIREACDAYGMQVMSYEATGTGHIFDVAKQGGSY